MPIKKQMNMNMSLGEMDPNCLRTSASGRGQRRLDGDRVS